MEDNELYRQAVEQFEREEVAAGELRAARKREAEIELLDNTSPQEFIRRRAAQRHLIVEPDLPLDEMSVSDYIKARMRTADDSDNERHELRTGRHSYRSYREMREAKDGR
jgi:hypothetical protein